MIFIIFIAVLFSALLTVSAWLDSDPFNKVTLEEWNTLKDRVEYLENHTISWTYNYTLELPEWNNDCGENITLN